MPGQSDRRLLLHRRVVYRGQGAAVALTQSGEGAGGWMLGEVEAPVL